jgi:hypothetical protein
VTSDGLRQDFTQQRDDATHMVARGQFRDHTAVGRVQVDLGMQARGQQAVRRVVEGKPGLVAGRFDAEDDQLEKTGFPELRV